MQYCSNALIFSDINHVTALVTHKISKQYLIAFIGLFNISQAVIRSLTGE